MSTANATTRDRRRAAVRRLIHDLLPWVLFWAIGASPWVAGLVGAAVALLLAVRDLRRGRRLQALDIGALAFFVAWMIAGLVAPENGVAWLSDYKAPASTLAFGLVMAATVVAGHPFTEAYARTDAPRAVWALPRFQRLNVFLSLMWAAILVIHGATAWAIQAAGGPAWINWPLLAATLIVGAVIQSRAVARAREQLRADLGATTTT